MENLEGKFIELIEKFETLSTKLAPEAIDIGLAAARVAAAQELIGFFILAGLTFWFSRKTKTAWPEAKFSDGEPENFQSWKVTGCGFVTTLLGAATAFSFSFWPFVGIVYPELWIAKRILGW